MSVEDFRAQFAEAAGFEPEAPAPGADTAIEVEAAEPEPEAVEEPQEPAEELAEPAEPEPDGDVAAYLEKYGGNVDEALKAAVEAQKVIGRQGSEVGELRKVADEMRALVESQQTPEPAAPTPSYDPGSIDEYLAENPHQIPTLAQQAIDTQDGYLYQQALKAWGELDQVGAMDFHARAVSQAEIAKLREEFAPAIQSAQRAETTNDFATAYESVAAKHDDFAPVMNSITEESIAGFPKTVIAALQTGDQATKQEVLETLYRWTKAEQAGNLTQAATQAAVKAQQDSRTARTEAAVASTTTSQSREAVTGIDAFHQQFQASDAFRKAAGLT